MTAELARLAPAAPRGAGALDSLAAAAAAVRDRLAPARAVTVVVNDPQRATRTRDVLELLRPALTGRSLRALVAAGTHSHARPSRQRFQRGVLAPLTFEAVAWHDCRSPELAEVPGRPGWRCHRWLLDEAAALLAIGSCEPHYFAGITGAHKTVTVGCAAFADVEANHAGALSAEARPGRLDGNPVHEGILGMLAGLEARREVLAIDLLQVGPTTCAAAGRPAEALERLAPHVRQAFFCALPAPADALVLEVDPVLARSFYQADKAIKNSEWAVRDGGCLVLAAECADGVGQDHFMRLLGQCPTHADAVETVRRRGYRLGDHKAVKLRHLTDRRGVRVFAVAAGLGAEEVGLLGFARAASVEAALAAAGVDPARHAVYRVADAANTCVTVAGRL